MTCPDVVSLIFAVSVILCSALCLSACDGGVTGVGEAGINVLPQEAASASSTGVALGPRELDILDKIKQRALNDGARYEFDQLNPVFTQNGNTMHIGFSFINPNTVGGTPVVEYSLSQAAITNIVYTQ